MRLLKSSALSILNKAIGLAGGSGISGETKLDDENLSQILNTNEIIRRSRSLAGSGGISFGSLQVASGAGATTETATLDPYNAGVTATPPWPAPVPDLFDVWMIGASVFFVSGTAANFNDGLLFTTYGAGSQGLSVDEAGLTIGGVSGSIPLGNWINIEVGSFDAGERDGGGMFLSLDRRLRRGETINFRVDASNAVVCQCNVILGLFPVALGQDVAF